jgi:hypothetical protein
MTVAGIIVVLALTGRPGPQRMADSPAVKEWIDAVTAHRPGTIDAPLITIGNAALADLQQIRQNVASVLKQHVASVDERNAVLRRGALLHMDIALLLPEEASRFTENDVPASHGRQEVARIFHSTDGRVAGLTVDTAHWWFATELLKQIRPDPAADPFVVAWIRDADAELKEAEKYFGGRSTRAVRWKHAFASAGCLARWGVTSRLPTRCGSRSNGSSRRTSGFSISPRAFSGPRRWRSGISTPPDSSTSGRAPRSRPLNRQSSRWRMPVSGPDSRRAPPPRCAI